MRYVVLSDTHGEVSQIYRAVEYIRALGPDAVIHLGDLCADTALLEREIRVPCYSVAGNCDAGRTLLPGTRVLESEGARILLCHGHQYGVNEGVQRLLYAAQEQGCQAALFGHTHRPYLEREQGVLLLNPGSLCQPRASQAGLAVLNVQKGSVRGLLLPYSGT